MADYQVVNITKADYKKLGDLCKTTGLPKGRQVAVLVNEKLSKCNHQLRSVVVQYPNNKDEPPRAGWYCPRCHKVYSE